MGRFVTKTRLVIVGGVVTGLVIAGIAVAYFTGTGSGTGTAAVGTSSALTIHGTVASSLYPGTSSTVSFTVDNSANGHQEVGTIHLASINACPAGDTWTGSGCSNGGTEITSCESVETGSSDGNTANFWMPDVVSNQDVAHGTGQALSASGTLTMNDLNSSQDSCKNANLTLNFTS